MQESKEKTKFENILTEFVSKNTNFQILKEFPFKEIKGINLAVLSEKVSLFETDYLIIMNPVKENKLYYSLRFSYEKTEECYNAYINGSYDINIMLNKARQGYLYLQN